MDRASLAARFLLLLIDLCTRKEIIPETWPAENLVDSAESDEPIMISLEEDYNLEINPDIDHESVYYGDMDKRNNCSTERTIRITSKQKYKRKKVCSWQTCKRTTIQERVNNTYYRGASAV